MRRFIVIDNDEQYDMIDNVTHKIKSDGFEIVGEYFDPTSHDCLDTTSKDFPIDKDKVISLLESKFTDKAIDLILLDFKLGDVKTDGIDLAVYIRKNWRNGKIPLIMYSADYNELLEKLEDKWNPSRFNGDFKSQFKQIKEYFYTFPDDTIKRDKTMADSLVEYFKKNSIDMENILLDKLNEYPNDVFKNINSTFDGMKLKAISKLIKKKSPEGEKFKSDIIERAVAHYIHLKN